MLRCLCHCLSDLMCCMQASQIWLCNITSLALQAVEHYTLGRNARVQDDDGSLSSSDEFDEHKELIGDAMSQPAVT